MLPSRDLAGTEITLVIQVDAVGDGGKAVRVAILFHDPEQGIFAVKAARAIVASVSGIFQLIRLNDLAGNLLLLGKAQSVFELSAGEARGIGDKREHLRAENFVGRKGQEGGIHSAGVGHE